MSKEKRFYWLKLQSDFFSSKRIKKLRKIAGGDTYTIIYLKMQLLSLENGGMITFSGLEQSFAEELALDLDEDPDNVEVALRFLSSCGLLESSDDINFFLPYVPDNIGTEGSSARRMRASRKQKAAAEIEQDPDEEMLQITDDCEGGEQCAHNVHLLAHNVQKCAHIVHAEKEKEEKKEKNQKKEEKKEIELFERDTTCRESAPSSAPEEPPKATADQKHRYGEYGHVLLKDEEHQKLVEKFGEVKAKELIAYLDQAIEEKGYKYKSHYLTIVKRDSWVQERVLKRGSPGYRTRFNNFDQRQNDLDANTHDDIMAKLSGI